MVDWILVFMFFAFLGYLIEVSYVYIDTKQWINRGYLNGPYIPIYAVGSVLAIIFLTNYYDNILIVFFMGMIICSALEYFTSYIMEKIFNQRWWDYSNAKYNIDGRITLTNSVLFGLGCVAIINYLAPFINKIISLLNPQLKLIVAMVFLFVFISDFIISTIKAYETSKNISKLDSLSYKLNIKQSEFLNKIQTRILKAYPHLIKNNQKLIEKVIKTKKDKKRKKKRN